MYHSVRPGHAEKPKPPPCPPPPEPELQPVVVGTIGKMHLVESRYELSRLGDVFAAFKPDLVFVAVRGDALREDRLEDASFEMSYARHLAKARGVPVEPIDWFREDDLVAPPAALEPYAVTEIERREAQLLRAPRLYTFEQANGAELHEKVLLAIGAAARHRGGDPLASRRRAWIQHLTADAVNRHGKGEARARLRRRPRSAGGRSGPSRHRLRRENLLQARNSPMERRSRPQRSPSGRAPEGDRAELERRAMVTRRLALASTTLPKARPFRATP